MVDTATTSDSLKSVLLLKDLVLLVQSVDTVNHLLDQLNLGVTQSVLVGNVICNASLSTRFSSGSTGLEVKFFTSGLQGLKPFLGISRKVNMDGCTHTSSQVGWAGVDITILGIKHEVLARFSLDRVSNSLDTSGKTIKDASDISSSLHGDDSELIFLIDPGQEGLVLVVEDATALWPVSLHTSSNEVTISGDKEEMIIDKLLTNSLIHSCEWVISSSKISCKVGKSLLHEAFNSNSLLLSNSRGKSKSIDGSSNPNTGGVDRGGGINVALDLVHIHVTGVDSIRRDAMVLLDQRVEYIGENLVRIPVPSIDTTVLVVKLDSTGNGLRE